MKKCVGDGELIIVSMTVSTLHSATHLGIRQNAIVPLTAFRCIQFFLLFYFLVFLFSTVSCCSVLYINLTHVGF